MKIKFLYLLLSLFLFGSLYADHDGDLYKGHGHYGQSPFSITFDQVSEQVELVEEDFDFDHSLFISSYCFKLFKKPATYRIDFSQTYFSQEHLGGHSGLSPPSNPNS